MDTIQFLFAYVIICIIVGNMACENTGGRYLLGILMGLLCPFALLFYSCSCQPPEYEIMDYAQEIIDNDPLIDESMVPPRGDRGTGYTRERSEWVTRYYDVVLPLRRAEKSR